MEALPFDQLQVKKDGSGRTSLRNCQFLRKVSVKPRMDNLVRDKKMGKDLIHQGDFGVPSASNKCTVPVRTLEPAVRREVMPNPVAVEPLRRSQRIAESKTVPKYT